MLEVLARLRTRPRSRRAPAAVPAVGLALQGGGAHGAFTWGVLDALLEDGRLRIAAVSGTSAGAVNGVMLADGIARGGADEARKRLSAFWRAASAGGDLPPLQRAVTDRLFALMPTGGSVMEGWFGRVTPYFSPYDLNPLDINPLRDLIDRHVDFDAVRRGPVELSVAATNVRSGRLHVFSREKLSAEAIMASAALPLLFRAVEIEGEAYWDGGYAGNPTLLPFLNGRGPADVILVRLNPTACSEVPRRPRDILARTQELTFGAALTGDLRLLSALAQGEGGQAPLRLHQIALEGDPDRTARGKLTTHYSHFEGLFEAGREAAGQFLAQHFSAIGQRTTFDATAESAVEWD